MSPTRPPFDLVSEPRADPGERTQQRGMHQLAPDQIRTTRSATTDSWIEIPSHPSSTSLTSAADEVVTTGLRVQQHPNDRHRRRENTSNRLAVRHGPSSAGGSSQDEYEESESESDRVMNSSNEGINPSFVARNAILRAEGDEDDENGTMLGVAPHNDQQCFTPQPNAFSHPPSSQARLEDPVPGSYFPSTRPSANQRHSYSGHGESKRNSHTPFSHSQGQADHDAALRASLSTLLSCAAAARGLSKPNQQRNGNGTRAQPTSNRVEPSTLRIVPESVALGEPSPVSHRSRPSSPSAPTRARSSSSSSSRDRNLIVRDREKPKRKSSSKDRARESSSRAAKKARSTLDANNANSSNISPTLLTWVVSAGVLVLVSALSFRAGYAVGKESGRIEAGWIGPGVDDLGASDCGREALSKGMGLKRLRWSSAGAGAAAVGGAMS